MTRGLRIRCSFIPKVLFFYFLGGLWNHHGFSRGFDSVELSHVLPKPSFLSFFTRPKLSKTEKERRETDKKVKDIDRKIENPKCYTTILRGSQKSPSLKTLFGRSATLPLRPPTPPGRPFDSPRQSSQTTNPPTHLAWSAGSLNLLAPLCGHVTITRIIHHESHPLIRNILKFYLTKISSNYTSITQRY